VAIVGLVPEVDWRVWDAPSWHYPVSTLLALEAVQAARHMTDGQVVSDRLDAALRRAWYVEGRCISVPSEIEEIARCVEGLDATLLMSALERGSHRHSLYEDWREAAQGAVRGSPHFFGPQGQHLHNPGVRYHWTKSPDDGGVPRFETYDRSWVDEALAWVA
jgi:predicted DsbA family dithiol-disulfide isomerase